MVLDDFFKNVPDHRILLLDQFFGLFDRGAMAALFQAMIDERLEQLERHFLRQATLVELQLRPDHDDRAPRIIDALSQKVLTEPALLAFERIGERLERPIVRPTQHTSTATVVEESIDSFLQHALFVAHDYVRRMQLDQLFQAIVAIDDAAIQVIQIAGGKSSAIERHQRTQLRRNHRNHIQNHPLRLVPGLAKTLGDAQALGEL